MVRRTVYIILAPFQQQMPESIQRYIQEQKERAEETVAPDSRTNIVRRYLLCEK